MALRNPVFRDQLFQRFLTSTAQMFDERGKGLTLRGARAQTDKGDKERLRSTPTTSPRHSKESQ